MANFTKLLDNLYTGGDLPSHLGRKAMQDDLQDYKYEKITHVLDARFEWNDSSFFQEYAPEIVYRNSGQDDIGQVIPKSWFQANVDFVLEALKNPDHKVLVHCHMGINRGPSLAFAVLLALNFTPLEAMSLIREKRPIAAVAYAGDALRWFYEDKKEREKALADLRAWHKENPLDIVRIIRTERKKEYSKERLG